MNDRILTLFSVLLLAAIIGVMSWRDMHPSPPVMQENAGNVVGYYADNNATAAMVPDDNLPITIAQGSFKYTAQGKTRFVRQGMAPATLAQRQVNLLLNFDALPQKPQATFTEIKALIESWKRQGTLIAVIFLDYRPPARPDFGAYSAFIEAFKEYFRMDPHALIPVAEAGWFDEQHKAGRQLLEKEISAFLVEPAGQSLSATELQKLAGADYAFQIRLPARASLAAPDVEALKKSGRFAGAFLTLDAQHPVLKPEPGVGIFPKFIERMRHDTQSR